MQAQTPPSPVTDLLCAALVRRGMEGAGTTDGASAITAMELHADIVAQDSPVLPGLLLRLARTFNLDETATLLLALAVAADADPSAQRVCAFLQNDPSLLRPSLGFALGLLGATQTAQQAAAPLLRQGLVRLENDPRLVAPPPATRILVPADDIAAFLTGDSLIPPAAAPLWRSYPPAMGPLPAARRWRIEFGADANDAVLALAAVESRGVLEIDLTGADPDSAADLAALSLRHAALRGAIAAIALPDRLPPGLAAALDIAACDIAITSGASVRSDYPVLAAPRADPAQRLAWWRAEAANAGLGLSQDETATLASRFRAGRSDIAAACIEAAASTGATTFPTVLRALHTRLGRDLAGFARRLQGTQGWDDLILPDAQMHQLRDLCDQVAQRHKVQESWGFGAGSGLGRGITALFSGPSGTGKTMAAGIVARALHLAVWRIDLSQTVSKFIGETEKNLDRIFAAAERADAVLFFDEADSLFGKRSEVKDAHDRYANLEVGYLLQKTEEYEGLAILATNLRHHLDEAFLRRLGMVIEFPFPDEEQRRRIWQVVFPSGAPLDPDIDTETLARDIRVTGGSIRTIAVNAAYMAAAEGSAIAQRHILRAAQAEYVKLGRSWE